MWLYGDRTNGTKTSQDLNYASQLRVKVARPKNAPEKYPHARRHLGSSRASTPGPTAFLSPPNHYSTRLHHDGHSSFYRRWRTSRTPGHPPNCRCDRRTAPAPISDVIVRPSLCNQSVSNSALSARARPSCQAPHPRKDGPPAVTSLSAVGILRNSNDSRGSHRERRE